jgi:hypothetical protein
MNISDLSALLKVATSSPTEAKALVKLLSVEVLKSLGNDTYLVKSDLKEFLATSENSNQPLKEGMKLWAQVEQKSNQDAFLKSFLQLPKIMDQLSGLQDNFKASTLLEILNSKNPANALKESVMEKMAQATSKEQFSSLSQMLLSLNHGVITLPVYYENYYALLQTKKRYNKESKKLSLDFYAALPFLGAIEGTIDLIEDEIYVNIDVEFEQSQKNTFKSC